jgi:hypothetical protein
MATSSPQIFDCSRFFPAFMSLLHALQFRGSISSVLEFSFTYLRVVGDGHISNLHCIGMGFVALVTFNFFVLSRGRGLAHTLYLFDGFAGSRGLVLYF